MKRIVMDIDGTITEAETSNYAEVAPNAAGVEKLRAYREDGFEIVLYTARNMRTHSNSLGRIVAHTVPGIIEWLTRNEVPYDEIWVGKPWCGTAGFYVDDKTIRPDEFERMSYEEIGQLLKLDTLAP